MADAGNYGAQYSNNANTDMSANTNAGGGTAGGSLNASSDYSLKY